jgi:acyl-CoA synthetase (AMP-forming)/AMP-acid ligase II
MCSTVRPSLVGCRDARSGRRYRKHCVPRRSPPHLDPDEVANHADRRGVIRHRPRGPGQRDARPRGSAGRPAGALANASPDRHRVQVWDTHALMLTSGTTRPSKLVKLTHHNPYFGGSAFFETRQCTADDIFQADMPLHHSGHQRQRTRRK